MNEVKRWAMGLGFFLSTCQCFAYTWTSPETISCQSEGAANSHLGMDKFGNAFVVWTSFDESTFFQKNAVHLAFLPIKSTWSYPTEIIPFNDKEINVKTLLTHPSGSLVVIYQTKNKNLEALHLTENQRFDFLPSLPFSSSKWSMAMDSHKNIYAIWDDESDERPKVRTGHLSLDDGRWIIDPLPLSDEEGVLTNFKLVCGKRDHIAGVWENQTNGEISVSIFSYEFGWSSPQVISQYVPGTQPSIAICPMGVVHVAWKSFRDGSYYASKFSTKSSHWSDPFSISTGVSEEGKLLQISCDDRGNAIAIWQTIPSPARIYLARLNFEDEFWKEPVPISLAESDAQFPSMDIDGLGNVYCVWVRNKAPRGVIESIVQYWDGSFSPITTLSLFSVMASFPKIVVHRGGRAVVTWNVNDFMNIDAIQSSIMSLNTPDSIRGKKNINRFLFHCEWFNTLEWSKNPYQDIAAFHIYRNGALIARLSANITKYEDHRRSKTQSDRYEVTAISSDGIESFAISISL